MTLEAAVKRIGVALLIAMPAASAQAGAALFLQIAQAGANETTPGGVEHQPTMEPDAASPMAAPPPPPAMPETVAPAAAEPVAPPADEVPSETNAGSQEKKNETKPENPPN